MTGRSRCIIKGGFANLSDLTPSEHKDFVMNAKRAIAKALGKKVIRIIDSESKE